MADTNQQFTNFEEFWPYYLRHHKRRETRLVHVAGTLLAALSIIKGLISLKIGWIILAPIIGYGFAFAAHKFIEHNEAVTFEHPKWSLRADLEMTKLWVTGKLEAELVRYDINT